MTHHVIIRIERRGSTNSRAFNYSHTSTDNVASGDPGSGANGFAHDRAGMIRTGVAVIRAGAASEQ